MAVAAYVSLSCPNCSTVHEHVPLDGDEDGRYADLDTHKCAEIACGKLLCSSCPQFHCDGCGRRYCQEHEIRNGDLRLCSGCAADAAADELGIGPLCAEAVRIAERASTLNEFSGLLRFHRINCEVCR